MKTEHLIRLSVLIAWIITCAMFVAYEKAEATVIVGIYNSNTLYVASDSLIQNATINGKSNVFQKIFIVSDTCCVSLGNNYGGRIQDPATKKVSILFLPDELAKICNAAMNLASLGSRITNIVQNFSVPYNKDLSQDFETNVPIKNLSSFLTFWGYDKEKKEFFVTSYCFDRTNQVTSQILMRRGETDVGGNLTIFAGIPCFLMGFIDLRTTFDPARRPEGFMKTSQFIQFGYPIDQKTMTNFIVQMFECHKKYASDYGDDSKIDEPYHIFKITKNYGVQLQ